MSFLEATEKEAEQQERSSNMFFLFLPIIVIFLINFITAGGGFAFRLGSAIGGGIVSFVVLLIPYFLSRAIMSKHNWYGLYLLLASIFIFLMYGGEVLRFLSGR